MDPKERLDFRDVFGKDMDLPTGTEVYMSGADLRKAGVSWEVAKEIKSPSHIGVWVRSMLADQDGVIFKRVG